MVWCYGVFVWLAASVVLSVGLGAALGTLGRRDRAVLAGSRGLEVVLGLPEQVGPCPAEVRTGLTV